MAIGLYIHVPFCVKKCNYCDFISYPYDAGLSASYLYALEKELAIYAAELSDEQRQVSSIYLGGGTPTLLSVEQLAAVLQKCQTLYYLQQNAEITLECNPGTADAKKLAGIRQAGFNRISIGVQACQERLLARLGRIHGWPEAEKTARWSVEAGFDNLSFDLIFGIPGQTMSDWQESLYRVLELRPQHISAYNLKIEPNTPMFQEAARGRLTPCDEELELEMYEYTIELLTGSGFSHYEISNFARPGFASRHNLVYWHNQAYLGLGPGAHSMLNHVRFNNVEMVETYITKLNEGLFPVRSRNVLTQADEISETIFLALRLMQGLDLAAFEQCFGRTVNELFGERVKKLIDFGLLKIEENYLKLTAKGIPLANEVFAEFI